MYAILIPDFSSRVAQSDPRTNNNASLTQMKVPMKTKIVRFLKKWFSARAFLITLVIAAAWVYGANSSKDYGTSEDTLRFIGFLMLAPTTGLVFFAGASIVDNDYHREPFLGRTAMSGPTIVSVATAMLIVNVATLLFGFEYISW